MKKTKKFKKISKKNKKSKKTKNKSSKLNKYNKLNKLIFKLNKELSRIPKKKYKDIYNNLLRNNNRVRSGLNIGSEDTWKEILVDQPIKFRKEHIGNTPISPFLKLIFNQYKKSTTNNKNIAK